MARYVGTGQGVVKWVYGYGPHGGATDGRIYYSLRAGCMRVRCEKQVRYGARDQGIPSHVTSVPLELLPVLDGASRD